MYNVILLAAGASRRMGFPKGLLPLQNTTLLDFQIRSIQALPLPIERTAVVLGHHAEAYQSRCSNLIQPPSDVVIATNSQPELGQFTSLKCGLNSIHRLHATLGRGAFILPIDCPCPTARTWKMLATALESGSLAAVPQTPLGRGHPVALSPQIVANVLASDIDGRLDLLIKKLPPETVNYIEVDDPHVTLNLNTPEEWENFRAEFTEVQ